MGVGSRIFSSHFFAVFLLKTNRVVLWRSAWVWPPHSTSRHIDGHYSYFPFPLILAVFRGVRMVTNILSSR